MLRLKDSVGYAIVFVATCTCRKCGITGSTGTGGGLHDLSGIIKMGEWAGGGSSGRLSHPGNPPPQRHCGPIASCKVLRWPRYLIITKDKPAT